MKKGRAIYLANCSACHGGIPTVSEGTDLVAVITAGGHEGMPAWSADLSADEIDREFDLNHALAHVDTIIDRVLEGV